VIISLSVLLRMTNVSDKCCRENKNINFMFKNFFSENHALYDIMWKKMVEPDRPHMTNITAHALCMLDN
jgi:hypothetical protein